MAQEPESKQNKENNNKKSIAFCMTINNYDDEWPEIISELDWLRGGIIGKEEASTGTPHLQC